MAFETFVARMTRRRGGAKDTATACVDGGRARGGAVDAEIRIADAREKEKRS